MVYERLVVHLQTVLEPGSHRVGLACRGDQHVQTAVRGRQHRRLPAGEGLRRRRPSAAGGRRGRGPGDGGEGRPALPEPAVRRDRDQHAWRTSVGDGEQVSAGWRTSVGGRGVFGAVRQEEHLLTEGGVRGRHVARVGGPGAGGRLLACGRGTKEPGQPLHCPLPPPLFTVPRPPHQGP